MSTKERVNISIDSHLLSEIDQWKEHLGLNRSEFFRQAVSQKIRRLRDKVLEEMYVKGYQEKPVEKDEFQPFIETQEWPEE